MERLLAHTVTAQEGSNAKSAWLFNMKQDHPQVPICGAAGVVVVLRDAAGNLSGTITLAYGRRKRVNCPQIRPFRES